MPLHRVCGWTRFSCRLVWGLQSQVVCIISSIPLFDRKGPFLHPDLISRQHRAQGRSRMPVGHRAAARSVLDGPEHGADLPLVGRDAAIRGSRVAVTREGRMGVSKAAQHLSFFETWLVDESGRTMRNRDGAFHRRARSSRATTLYPAGLEARTHDAPMRIGGEAPRRRAQSDKRHGGHGDVRAAPPRIVIGTRPQRRRASKPLTDPDQTACMVTPSGSCPVVAKRHRSTSSLRANATISVLRTPPLAPVVRPRYHAAKVLSF